MAKKTEIDFLIEQIEMDTLYAEGQMPESLDNNTEEYRVSILKVEGKSKVPMKAREITVKASDKETAKAKAAKEIEERFGLKVLESRVEDKTLSDILNRAKKTRRDAMNKEQRQANFKNQAARQAAQHMRRTASHSARTMRMMTPFF